MRHRRQIYSGCILTTAQIPTPNSCSVKPKMMDERQPFHVVVVLNRLVVWCSLCT